MLVFIIVNNNFHLKKLNRLKSKSENLANTTKFHDFAPFKKKSE